MAMAPDVIDRAASTYTETLKFGRNLVLRVDLVGGRRATGVEANDRKDCHVSSD